MSPEYFDDEDKKLLLETYSNDKSDSEKAALLKIVRKYSAQLNRTRRPGKRRKSSPNRPKSDSHAARQGQG